MKRERYIITIIILMCILFTWGLVKCTEARADHWRATGSLLPGEYMLTYLSMPGPGVVAFIGAMIVFDSERCNTDEVARFLNADPATQEWQSPTLFKWEGEWWRQIPLPLKWTLGDEVM